LIPLKIQSEIWNKCFKNSACWINKKDKNLAEFNNIEESLEVAMFNGFVYEPPPKIK